RSPASRRPSPPRWTASRSPSCSGRSEREVPMSTATAPHAGTEPEETVKELEPGKGFELVNGQLKELNVSAKSSWIGGQLFLLLALYCKTQRPGWVFPADTSFRCFPDDKNR